MLSRVANLIYWMDRYLERADNVARFIEVNMHLILDLELKSDSAIIWQPLLEASGDTLTFNKQYNEVNEENVLHFLTFDRKNPNSIISCIQRARENARAVREIISSEMWECINDLHHLVQKHSRKSSLNDLQNFYKQIRLTTYLFIGIAEVTQAHVESWHFSNLGRMLERADKTARIIDVKYFLLLPGPDYFDSPLDAVEWGAVLKSASAFEMYRKSYQRINYKDVADFLIFNPNFPRSLNYCVSAASNSLQQIMASLESNAISMPIEMTKLLQMVKEANVEQVLTNGLHEFIDDFQFNLNVLDQLIYNTYFSQQCVEKLPNNTTTQSTE